MDERENILNHLEDILGDVTGVELVTRDMRPVLVGSLSEYPAIFIDDRGDEIAELNVSQGYAAIDYRRVLSVAFVAAYKATSDANAASEMAAFLKKIKKVLYGRIAECTNVDFFAETGTTELDYKDTPRVVLQGILAEIHYIEQTSKLFT